MDKTVVVNIEKCLACKSCEIACALAHSKSKVLEKAVAESPRPQRMVTVEPAGEFGVPIQCRHCEDAPCITVCPTVAMPSVGTAASAGQIGRTDAFGKDLLGMPALTDCCTAGNCHG